MRFFCAVPSLGSPDTATCHGIIFKKLDYFLSARRYLVVGSAMDRQRNTFCKFCFTEVLPRQQTFDLHLQREAILRLSLPTFDARMISTSLALVCQCVIRDECCKDHNDDWPHGYLSFC
jgi:hypothetical protein